MAQAAQIRTVILQDTTKRPSRYLKGVFKALSRYPFFFRVASIVPSNDIGSRLVLVILKVA